MAAVPEPTAPGPVTLPQQTATHTRNAAHRLFQPPPAQLSHSSALQYGQDVHRTIPARGRNPADLLLRRGVSHTNRSPLGCCEVPRDSEDGDGRSDLLLERLAGEGLVAPGGRQRTDATHVLAAVRSLNRLEFIGETLRAAMEALAVAAPDWMRTVMDPVWQECYGTRVDAYRLPTDEQERRGLARQIGCGRGHERTGPLVVTRLRHQARPKKLVARSVEQFHRVCVHRGHPWVRLLRTPVRFYRSGEAGGLLSE
ncbi:hypothetical protein GA0115249_10971 [Streptomyces sp. PpalLS-921]|nr:hypothetical protein GA0115249_10971 [Streptomyces sp. PpalLS-921]